MYRVRVRAGRQVGDEMLGTAWKQECESIDAAMEFVQECLATIKEQGSFIRLVLVEPMTLGADAVS